MKCDMDMPLGLYMKKVGLAYNDFANYVFKGIFEDSTIETSEWHVKKLLPYCNIDAKDIEKLERQRKIFKDMTLYVPKEESEHQFIKLPFEGYVTLDYYILRYHNANEDSAKWLRSRMNAYTKEGFLEDYKKYQSYKDYLDKENELEHLQNQQCTSEDRFKELLENDRKNICKSLKKSLHIELDKCNKTDKQKILLLFMYNKKAKYILEKPSFYNIASQLTIKELQNGLTKQERLYIPFVSAVMSELAIVKICTTNICVQQIMDDMHVIFRELLACAYEIARIAYAAGNNGNSVLKSGYLMLYKLTDELLVIAEAYRQETTGNLSGNGMRKIHDLEDFYDFMAERNIECCLSYYQELMKEYLQQSLEILPTLEQMEKLREFLGTHPEKINIGEEEENEILEFMTANKNDLAEILFLTYCRDEKTRKKFYNNQRDFAKKTYIILKYMNAKGEGVFEKSNEVHGKAIIACLQELLLMYDIKLQFNESYYNHSQQGKQKMVANTIEKEWDTTWDIHHGIIMQAVQQRMLLIGIEELQVSWIRLSMDRIINCLSYASSSISLCEKRKLFDTMARHCYASRQEILRKLKR